MLIVVTHIAMHKIPKFMMEDGNRQLRIVQDAVNALLASIVDKEHAKLYQDQVH